MTNFVELEQISVLKQNFRYSNPYLFAQAVDTFTCAIVCALHLKQRKVILGELERRDKCTKIIETITCLPKNRTTGTITLPNGPWKRILILSGWLLPKCVKTKIKPRHSARRKDYTSLRISSPEAFINESLAYSEHKSHTVPCSNSKFKYLACI